MKRLLLTLTLALFLFSCNNEGMENESKYPIDNSDSALIGTWEGDNGYFHSKITFRADDYIWELTTENNPVTNTATGTWTYDETQFTLYYDGTPPVFSFPYRIEGNILIFSHIFYGTVSHNKID